MINATLLCKTTSGKFNVHGRVGTPTTPQSRLETLLSILSSPYSETHFDFLNGYALLYNVIECSAMTERIVQDVLDQTLQEEFDLARLVQSFDLLTEHLRTSTLEPGSRDAVCKAIVDSTLPKLTLIALREREQLATLCLQVLSHGDPDKVFHDLCMSLKRAGYAVPMNARFLITFVSNDGVRRLARILTKLESQETVSLLIHLPSLVMNALGTSDSEKILLNEREYFISLSKAICRVAFVSDHQSSSFIGNLLQRMVTLGKAQVLISSCFEFEGGRHLRAILQRTPHASIQAMVRAVLEVDISSSEHPDEDMLKNVLSSVILKNATAEQACIRRIPFSQPPFILPKIALSRLVDAVACKQEESTWKHVVTTAASVWSSPEFIYCAELALQQQVTRLLLYYMSRRIRDKMRVITEADGLVLLFSPGIQLRLSENDPRIRRHGMVVGEAASRTENGIQKLSFPRGDLKEEISASTKIEGKTSSDEGSDSDFSMLADDVNSNGGVEQTSVQGDQNSAEVLDASTPESLSVSSGKSNSCHVRRHSKGSWALRSQDDYWQFEDDWESIDSWEDEDNTVDTQSAVMHLEVVDGDGTAFRVPISVNHLLGVMINANKSRGGGLTVDTETVAAALDQISTLPDSGLVYGDTLRLAAVELCLEVCRLDVERYPDEDKEKLLTARHKALEQMICVDLQGCGLALISKVICGPSSDINSRIEALSVLTKAFRLSCTTNSLENQPVNSSGSDGGMRFEGIRNRVVERTFAKSRTVIEQGKTLLNSAHSLKITGMVNVFHHLAQKMCEGGGAEFMDVENRDSQLWGHAIVALATVASCAGMCREGVEMRGSVIEISMRRVLIFEADAVVRRAVVLAVITVIKSMGTTEVSEVLVAAVSPNELTGVSRSSTVDVTAECFHWLSRAAEFDADIGVRRFTKQALGLWARRVEQIT